MAAFVPVRAAFGQSAEMRRFRTQVLEILDQKYPQLKARAGDEDSLIEIDAGAIDLTNLLGKVRELPADGRQAAIADYVDRLVERVVKPEDAPRSSWAEMSKRLRPRLVSPEMRQAAPTVLLRAFATGALSAYVLDHGRQVEYVQRDMLEPWSVDSQRVHDAAVANLEALSEDVEIEVSEARGGGRFTAIDTDDLRCRAPGAAALSQSSSVCSGHTDLRRHSQPRFLGGLVGRRPIRCLCRPGGKGLRQAAVSDHRRSLSR